MNCDRISRYTHRKTLHRTVAMIFVVFPREGGVLGDFPQPPDTFLRGLSLFLQ